MRPLNLALYPRSPSLAFTCEPAAPFCSLSSCQPQNSSPSVLSTHDAHLHNVATRRTPRTF
eukprot:82464-Pleurochrysis_carterae.AAC.1